MITEANRKWWVAVSIGTAAGLVLLDESIVGVALPQIAQDLAMSTAASHWVVSAYLVTFAGFAGTGGRFADIFGIRRVFLVGVMLFALASVLAGASVSGAWLIAARVLQGLAAAIVFPVAFAMVTTSFPDEEKGSALGLLAAIGTTMLAAGPFVGGVFTQFIDWRFIFYVNIPLAALAMAAIVILAPRATAAPKGPAIDVGGLVTLMPGLVLFVVGIMQGPHWGWGSPAVLGALAAGVAILTAFAVLEYRAATPLVDVRLFGYRAVTAAAIVFLAGQFVKIVMVVFVPLYLQHVLGISPILAGALMVAGVLGSPFASVPAGRIADKIGSRKPALLGVLVCMLGTAVVGIGATMNREIVILAALLVWGFGLPFMFLPAARAVMQAVPRARQGEAAGITVTARLIGGVLGMSLGSAVYASFGRYDAVFYATAVLLAAVLAIAFWAMEPAAQEPA